MTKRQKKFMKAMRPYLWTMWNDEIASSCEAFDALYVKHCIIKKKITNTAAMRYKLLILSERQNHRCCYCGVDTWHPEINDGGSIPHHCLTRSTIEHVISKSKGGTNHIDNLVMACYECNSVRGNTDHEKFIKTISKEEIVEPAQVLKQKKLPKNDDETTIRIFKRLYIFLECWPDEFHETLEYVEGDFYQALVNRTPKKKKKTGKRNNRLNKIRERVQSNNMAIAA